MKYKLSTPFVENKDANIKKMQLEKRKDVYKALNMYIFSLKSSLDIASKEDKKVLVKEIKEMSALQDYFYNSERDV